ncbi:MAG: GrpB family protein [bacterium]
MKKKESFDYKDRKYDVVACDPNWQTRFNDEARIIKEIFGSEIRIEHVGSTSVEGMEGKPCIDILVILNDLSVIKDHISEMENVGYLYRGSYVSDDSFLFTKVKDNIIETNVHFFREGHQHVKEMLTLRDYLRNNPKEISEYSQLKRDLYKKYSNNYKEYRKEKDEYMQKLNERAKNYKFN